MAYCRQLPKIESCFFFLPLLLLRCQRKGRGFKEENFTAGYKAVRDRGSSPEMNRGGSLRRRLSSLRGAWRWSTGYLFRKVGRAGEQMDGCLDGYSVSQLEGHLESSQHGCRSFYFFRLLLPSAFLRFFLSS